jgi:hypothetical protein
VFAFTAIHAIVDPTRAAASDFDSGRRLTPISADGVRYYWECGERWLVGDAKPWPPDEVKIALALRAQGGRSAQHCDVLRVSERPARGPSAARNVADSGGRRAVDIG